LAEAFRRTGVDKTSFEPKEWAKDINGKSGVVYWKGPKGAEVSIDAPHTRRGPDVFHIGYKTQGKGNQLRGIFF